MRVLLLGSGAREHALASAIVADPVVTDLICSPGNPGIASLTTSAGKQVQIIQSDISQPEVVVALAEENMADFVLVGPEKPLVAGVADALTRKGIPCFGPSQAASMIEGSKAFAKDVMAAVGVPTARSRLCVTSQELEQALEVFSAPYVVKDDGLAAGKGVVVTTDRAEALAHGLACQKTIVEEYLVGPEVSLFVVTDGIEAVPLIPAQDFKRVGDGDVGLNTGGMGAYAPLSWVPDSLINEVMETIIKPTLTEMANRGTPFVGLLYAGLVLTADGPKVIEFNCRFGDPETQAVLAMLQTPLAGFLYAAATGTLSSHPPLVWRDGAAVTVVLAAAGYPGTPKYGDIITGADGVPGILHAGTARSFHDPNQLISAGGRVVCATGVAETLVRARDEAYRLVEGVKLDGAHYRSDIALAAIRGDVTIPTRISCEAYQRD